MEHPREYKDIIVPIGTKRFEDIINDRLTTFVTTGNTLVTGELFSFVELDMSGRPTQREALVIAEKVYDSDHLDKKVVKFRKVEMSCI